MTTINKSNKPKHVKTTAKATMKTKKNSDPGSVHSQIMAQACHIASEPDFTTVAVNALIRSFLRQGRIAVAQRLAVNAGISLPADLAMPQ